MISEFVYKNHQKLRYGYTTGTCAAAATKAAVRMLFSGTPISSIEISTPKGINLNLEVLDIKICDKFVSCAIKKDAGDDADCTNGILIYSTVSPAPNDINIDGGDGIGRVTKPGLEHPVGSAAINNVPRKMIKMAAIDELEKAGIESGLNIIISAPDGKEIAKKTFNPRLGIEGGISILGTSGIVEPMSEQALIDTIRVEMKQKKAQSEDILLICPGNYGRNFARETWGIDLEQGLKCSNFIGDTLDMALELVFDKILFIGHIGKLVKVAAGIMNTHSHIADARMETLCSCALLSGCSRDTAVKILLCRTTDEAIELLIKDNILKQTMNIMLDKILVNMKKRTENRIQIEVIVFSNQAGVLAISEGADKFINQIIHNPTAI